MALLAGVSCGPEGDAGTAAPPTENPHEFVLDEPGWDEADSSRLEDWVTLRHPSGAKRAEGRQRDGRKQGEWTYWRDDGSLRWRGSFENDVAEGPERAWHANGQVWFEGQRSKGLREGLYRYWYENGALELEAHFQADRRHGLCRRFNVDGQLDAAQSGRYEAGQKVAEL